MINDMYLNFDKFFGVCILWVGWDVKIINYFYKKILRKTINFIKIVNKKKILNFFRKAFYLQILI